MARGHHKWPIVNHDLRMYALLAWDKTTWFSRCNTALTCTWWPQYKTVLRALSLHF